MGNFAELFQKGVAAGNAHKESLAQRERAAEQIKLEKEGLQLRAKALDHELKRHEFSMQSNSAESAIKALTGAPTQEMLAPGPFSNQDGSPIDVGQTRGAAPNPTIQLPQWNAPSIPITPPNQQQEMDQKAQEIALGAQKVTADTTARVQATRAAEAANPVMYKPSVQEAVLSGLPESANKEMPIEEWKALVASKARDRDDDRADKRDANAAARSEQAAIRAEKRLSESRVKNLQTQWRLTPGVADAAKAEQMTAIVERVGQIYDERLKTGKTVGEAEEIVLIGRLRSIEPDSVVREGEFIRLQGMSALADRFTQFFATMKRGGKVPPEVVRQGVETVREVQKVRDRWLAQQAQPLLNQAKALEVPLDQLSFGKYAGGQSSPAGSALTPTLRFNPATGKLEPIK